MAHVHKFKSTDAGAPAISGQVDTLRALLQALLVDGYNSKTVTITRSGAVATASSTAHGFVDKHVLVHSGAGETEYNVQVEITRIDANTYTFPVSGTPATPATGTITAKVAPAGWTQPFTGTNKGAFLQPAGSNGFYLRVDDSNAQNSQVRGYETMSDVDTGTNLFPTNAQITVGSGPYFYKSSAASSTARAWVAFVCKGSIALFVNTDGANVTQPLLWGDGLSELVGDPYFTYNLAQGLSSAVSAANLTGTLITNNPASTVHAGCHIARSYSGAAGAITTHKFGSVYVSTGALQPGSSGQITYPAPIPGGIIIEPMWLSEAGVVAPGPRGRVAGVWLFDHTAPLTAGDTLDGAAGSPYAGKSFEVVKVGAGASNQMAIQTTDWFA